MELTENPVLNGYCSASKRKISFLIFIRFPHVTECWIRTDQLLRMFYFSYTRLILEQLELSKNHEQLSYLPHKFVAKNLTFGSVDINVTTLPAHWRLCLHRALNNLSVENPSHITPSPLLAC